MINLPKTVAWFAEYDDKIYTEAQPERAPLTFEQIDEIWVEHGLDHCGAHAFARAIEAAHGIKGGQHD